MHLHYSINPVTANIEKNIPNLTIKAFVFGRTVISMVKRALKAVIIVHKAEIRADKWIVALEGKIS